MGFLMEESSCILITHILYKAALVFALLRWAFSWAVKLRNTLSSSSTSSSSSSSGSRVSAQMIRDNLGLTTYGQMVDCRHRKCDTCAVCLCPIEVDEEVRELRNCCHVFHRECIDTWVDHHHHSDDNICSDEDVDNHRSCPLCRAPLLTSSQSLAGPDQYWPRSEPSWAVDGILYLFADDLLY